MSEKRWASRGLVNLLVFEMKNYQSAAEVVSGATDVFAMYSRLLGDVIAKAQELPAGVKFLELQRVIDTAREEIKEHQQWQDEVFSSLPKEDDESGATGPLRQAFTSTAADRARLLQEIMTAHEKYLKAQAGAFNPD